MSRDFTMGLLPPQQGSPMWAAGRRYWWYTSCFLPLQSPLYSNETRMLCATSLVSCELSGGFP